MPDHDVPPRPSEARTVLEALRRWPRLGQWLRRSGAILLVGLPFFVMGLLALGGLLPEDVSQRLDAWGERHPLLLLVLGVAMLAALMHMASLLSFKLSYLGRQLEAVGQAAALREAPERPPVVYLRPFAADEAAPPGFRQRMAVVGANVLRSVEEQLAQVVAPIGPLVAIGAPGEALPTPGAVRRYAADDEWQGLVRQWLARARLIIIRPAASEGLLWELGEVLRAMPPDRVVMLVTDMRAQPYQSLVGMLGERLAIRLPPFAEVARMGRVAGFFEFGPGWAPRFLPLKAPWLRDTPWQPMRACLHHSLQPVFARLGVPWSPAPVSRWKVMLAVLFVTAAVIAAFGLAMG